MAKFRKKPVVIDATQWFKNGDHPLDYAHARPHAEAQVHPPVNVDLVEGQVVRRYRHPNMGDKDQCQHCGRAMRAHGWIDTLEGGHIVCPGDWIITGVQGEHYPCKPDIFEATYEPAVD